MEIKRILAYTDLSDASADALIVARHLAGAFDAGLHVLRVVTDPLSVGWTAEVSASALPEVQEAMEIETREYLDRVMDASPFGRVDTTLDIETGGASEEIINYVASRKIDLVVLGVDRDAAEGYEQEQTATDVLRRGLCSVLVVREPAASAGAHRDPADEDGAADPADGDPDLPEGA
jgi:nucleotide-binding universal stress UspA family protein